MNKLHILLLSTLTAASVAVAASAGNPASDTQSPDSVRQQNFTASDVLVRMTGETLDILTVSQRKDMLDYYKADSVCNVMNVMEGFSHLNPPVTDGYLQVQITPVTRYTVKILPGKKGEKIAMTIYTVGDSLQAPDSEIRFYDSDMQELKRDKFINPVSTVDFLDLKKTSGKEKKELKSLIPFPTVEYTVSPDGYTMEAELTVGAFLGKEVLSQLEPYLVRTRQYRWNGDKWELVK